MVNLLQAVCVPWLNDVAAWLCEAFLPGFAPGEKSRDAPGDPQCIANNIKLCSDFQSRFLCLQVVLYKGNTGHQEVLRTEGKCGVYDPVPLVLVKDIMTYMPQMKYMFRYKTCLCFNLWKPKLKQTFNFFSNMMAGEGPAGKRPRVAWAQNQVLEWRRFSEERRKFEISDFEKICFRNQKTINNQLVAKI